MAAPDTLTVTVSPSTRLSIVAVGHLSVPSYTAVRSDSSVPSHVLSPRVHFSTAVLFDIVK